MGELYTIGHSTYPVKNIIQLLQHFNIHYVLDVRSMPYSKYAPQYNKDTLSNTLKSNDITYAYMGKYFGARQLDENYYPEGYLDFELFRGSELFKSGLNNVQKGLEKYNIALMCTEKNPFDCHRAIMVSRGFELVGINVQHILHDFTSISQEELNNQLLECYFPDRGQITLFDNIEKTAEQYLIDAYRERNKEIGYYLHGKKKGD